MKNQLDILVIMNDQMLLTQLEILLMDIGYSVKSCPVSKISKENLYCKAILMDETSQKLFLEKQNENTNYDRVFVFIDKENQIHPKLKFANLIYKPFMFESFIENLGKKIQSSVKKSFEFGSFTFLPIMRGFYKEEEKILSLTELETNFIVFLSDNKYGATKSEILLSVWGHTKELNTHALESLIYRLRKKFENKLNKKDFIIQKKNKYVLKKY